MRNNKNLFLITYDYPYGTGEPFLEVEIKYLSESFDQIYILSTSQNITLTRNVPENVKVIKCDRRYHPVKCVLYSLCKFFSIEFLCECFVTRSIDCVPSWIQLLKGCFRTWCIKKRIDIAVKKNKIDSYNSIAYSYWLAEGAYFIAKNSEKWALGISRAHGYEVRDYESFFPFRTIINEKLNTIYFISEYTKNEYERIISNYRKKSCQQAERMVIHLGVQQPTVKSKKECKNTSFLLVSVSSIYPLKRLDLIVDILEKYSGEKTIKWVHFGWGSLGKLVKQQCENKLNKKKNIEYTFVGQVSNQEILSFYENNSVSLFINTSDNEGVPVSIMEAMSFGIPCIARNVGGNAEIVKDSVTGYLVDKFADASEIAKKLESIVAGNVCFNPEKIKKWIFENYCSERNYQFFISHVYESISN